MSNLVSAGICHIIQLSLSVALSEWHAIEHRPHLPSMYARCGVRLGVRVELAARTRRQPARECKWMCHLDLCRLSPPNASDLLRLPHPAEVNLLEPRALHAPSGSSAASVPPGVGPAGPQPFCTAFARPLALLAALRRHAYQKSFAWPHALLPARMDERPTGMSCAYSWGGG